MGEGCMVQVATGASVSAWNPLFCEIGLYANAYGSERPAQIAHVCIRNVEAVDVDPRYPILIMGMMDGKCKDITLQNIKVTYRGGLSMEHAAEQRQLNTWWKYEQFHAEPRVQ